MFCKKIKLACKRLIMRISINFTCEFRIKGQKSINIHDKKCIYHISIKYLAFSFKFINFAYT